MKKSQKKQNSKQSQHDPYHANYKCKVCSKDIKVLYKWSDMAKQYVEADIAPVDSLRTPYGWACGIPHYNQLTKQEG
jgi:hypothetical protein